MERQFIFRHRDLVVGAESFDLEVTPTNFGINKPLQAVWSSSLIEFNNQLPETGWNPCYSNCDIGIQRITIL